ncbi:MAG: site-specific integrase [Desulfovibrio sp.]|nr:site-specific integrase [Desulfovibrio sp.]
MDCAETHIQRVIIGSQLGTRVGPCELFQLTWDDVDLNQRILRVHGSKKKQKRSVARSANQGKPYFHF